MFYNLGPRLGATSLHGQKQVFSQFGSFYVLIYGLINIITNADY